MQKALFFALALMALSPSLSAAVPSPPDAGSQMQQIPPPPSLNKAPPDIRIEHGNTPTLPESDQTKIRVKSLHVTGARRYSEAQLVEVTGLRSEQDMTLTGLRTLAAKITNYYHQNGYFLAQAHLPAQEIKNGVVTIAVLEGRYGKVSLHNRSRLSDALASSLLNGLDSGDTIAIAPLENRLLLLSDIPGVDVKSTLTPGASVGASDLMVELTPGRYVTGSIDADNEGNRYTGSGRLGATININNPAGHGDVFTFRALSSFTGLTYGRIAYQLALGRAQLGAAYSDMEYHLGAEFASLSARGKARIASLYGSYPVIRSRNNNLFALLDYDSKVFWDNVEATATVTDKDAQAGMASLNGNYRDGFGGGGFSSYSITWTHGDIDIQSPAVRESDATTAHSNGTYDKLSLQAARLQNLTEMTSFYAAVSGQFASKNLDTSEKMELGGTGAVRAYPEGEAYADEGYVLKLEARRLLPKFSERLAGRIQLVGFFDTGTVTLNKHVWSPGQNSKTLSGIGIGLNWFKTNNFAITADFAHKVGDAVAASAPDAKNRFWIQGVKYL